MKKTALFFLCLILTFSILGQNSEKRIALVIGNAAYQHGGVLRNPVNDANLIAKTLTELGFEVTKKTNASLRTMQIAAAQFKQKIRNYDVALFFYAGHGIQVDGNNYLIPVDAKLDSREMAKYDAFNINDINIAFMSNSKKVNVMILDACRNDPFRSWARGGERGFAKIENSAKGTIIAFATQPGETADDGSGNNGLYTEKLVKQMKKPQSIEKVFKMARIEVNKASNGKQVPQDWSSLMAEFSFVKGNASNISTNVTVSNTTNDLPNYLNDPRDNKRYKIVEIGNQMWMAENLAFDYGSGCWAYDNDQSNVTKYGYLYNWETAKNVCPSGWRLPIKGDYDKLLNNYGGTSDYKAYYTALITGGESGFLALFAGMSVGDCCFDYMGKLATFWSSSKTDGTHAMFLSINSSMKGALMYNTTKAAGLSVRCLQE